MMRAPREAMRLGLAMWPTRRALVIDDTASVVILVTRVLESEGYGVRATRSGPEALKLLQSEPFSLVVTDYRMPGPNGLELARRARDLRLDVPLVLMTAYATAEIVSQASTLRVSGILLKPFTALELRRIVESVTATR